MIKLTVEQAGELKGIPASIYGKYGLAAINEAFERLCKTCQPERWVGSRCKFLPLTLDGCDCPYYQKKESKS